jgi:sulfite reductase subunit B
MKQVTLKESEYNTKAGKILRTKSMSAQEMFFEVSLPHGESLDHIPGQFVMVNLPGIGEAPISISSSPTKRSSFDMVVRNVGKVTGAMHNLQAGDIIGIRGPYGKGFPIQVLEGNDLIFFAGGLGIVPLRSLINFVIDNRRDFGGVDIIVGCKSPKDRLFKDEIKEWEQRLDINFQCTVDNADDDWKGNVGVITSLIPGLEFDPVKTFAVICGPPVMYRFVIFDLLKEGVLPDQIMVSLERHMKCGVGKCGHCQIANYYCCQDGPVFRYDEIKDTIEAL